MLQLRFKHNVPVVDNTVKGNACLRAKLGKNICIIAVGTQFLGKNALKAFLAQPAPVKPPDSA
ncbi:MAG: hypothetical protein K2K40_00570 [Paramuribaculum sp.]|nr:hypothetical protein [Paramuribaculum sp.]